MRLIPFLLRVLICSAIAFPAMAQEVAPRSQPYSPAPLVVPTPNPQPAPELPQLQLPAPDAPPVVIPDVPPATVPGQAAPFVGDASAPDYWIVSSRCSSQSFQEVCRGPWRLDVYHRTPDLHLRGASLEALSAGLVTGIPVCIFSHGSFVDWESQCRQAHDFYVRLRHVCQGPLQVIFFTWPSETHHPLAIPFEVNQRGRQAEFNGFYINSLLMHIPASCPVSLVGHSHGARVILAAMHLLGGGTVAGHASSCPYRGHRYRVVVAAAAIDHDWLNPGEVYGCALNRIECMLVYRNRHDLALGAYPFSKLFGHRAMGKAGITRWDERRLGWSAQKIRVCDVSADVGHSHYWPYYYRDASVVGALVPYVYFY